MKKLVLLVISVSLFAVYGCGKLPDDKSKKEGQVTYKIIEGSYYNTYHADSLRFTDHGCVVYKNKDSMLLFNVPIKVIY